MRTLTSWLCLTLFTLAFLPLAGCQQQGTFEEAGENIDETFEDAGDAIEDATDPD